MIHQQPEIGAQTQQLKVLEEQTSGHHCDLSLEGVGWEDLYVTSAGK